LNLCSMLHEKINDKIIDDNCMALAFNVIEKFNAKKDNNLSSFSAYSKNLAIKEVSTKLFEIKKCLENQIHKYNASNQQELTKYIEEIKNDIVAIFPYMTEMSLEKGNNIMNYYNNLMDYCNNLNYLELNPKQIWMMQFSLYQ